MAIRKYLDCSYEHLPESLRERFADIFNLGTPTGVIVHPYDFGAFVWVPEDPEAWTKQYADEEDDPYPAALLKVQVYAAGKGCDYIHFDSDAECIDELPLYEGDAETCCDGACAPRKA